MKIWVARYLPEINSISTSVRSHIEQRLRVSITDEARQATHRQLSKQLASDCAHAAIDTQKLLSAMGLSIGVWELQELSLKIHKIYTALLDCYAQVCIFSPVLDHLHTIETESDRLEATGSVIPRFESLMLKLVPLLQELKIAHFSSENRHLRGFITTQIHFTRQHILSHLTPDTSFWLAPYLRLLDEVICMPWHHIVSMASTNTATPDSIALVRKMMPKVNEITALTYKKALQTYPEHISCQGRIQSNEVYQSSIRDLNMLQAYIWLCIVGDDISIIEHQLIPLCLQVFPLTMFEDRDWSRVIFEERCRPHKRN